MAPSVTLQSGNVLGVKVSAVNLAQAVDIIDDTIEVGPPGYVCVAPAHSIMECWRDSEVKSIFNRSALVTPDGMSLVWMLRMQGYRHVTRVYGPDLMRAVLQRTDKEGRLHFLYGSTERILTSLRDRLNQDYPKSKILGSIAPPFRALTADEDAALIDEIDRAAPDVVWVGLGSPKQERWMAQHRDRLKAPVLIGVGAAFDFLSGEKPQAPLWMQRSGTEWLFRLATEPRRLWPRYRQYPLFVLLVLAQMLGLRKYPISED